MDYNLCRICLCSENLSPIFVNNDQSRSFSAVLALTTGLKININDGFPQNICEKCTNMVNIALQLRNLSQDSEKKLIEIGYQRNIIISDEKNEPLDEKHNLVEEISEDCYDLTGFKIEVELDRISENGVTEIEDRKKIKTEAKEAEVKPRSRKEKRELYMSLVEGGYDPKKPVKCKICKTTVSKWACFINHAKKHLGFKFMCEFCGKSFISSNQLKRHCRSYHGLEREMKCKHCDYLALDNAQLVVHERRMHTGVRPYVCDDCGASYFSRKCLVQHIESHRTTASVQCDKCPQLFKSRRHLSKHKYGAHGEKRRERRRAQRAMAAQNAE